jgi:hypothetical protein
MSRALFSSPIVVPAGAVYVRVKPPGRLGGFPLLLRQIHLLFGVWLSRRDGASREVCGGSLSRCEAR